MRNELRNELLYERIEFFKSCRRLNAVRRRKEGRTPFRVERGQTLTRIIQELEAELQPALLTDGA